jgi:hypothetical protein
MENPQKQMNVLSCKYEQVLLAACAAVAGRRAYGCAFA